ncbi:MAG: hypothetical protein P8O20_08535 [Bacteroidia bacterium]|jgi:hypothetical protein|nr:hypothetical protein [Bacteroidia bacterium]
MKYVLIGLFFISVGALQGQGRTHKREQRDSIKKAMLIELKAYRVGLIKTELDLDEKTSLVFFAVYDPYFQSTSTLKKAFGKKWRGISKSEMSEIEASEYLNDVLTLRKKEIELLEDVSEKLKGIIPMNKIIELSALEKRVKRKLLKKARELRKRGKK